MLFKILYAFISITVGMSVLDNTRTKLLENGLCACLTIPAAVVFGVANYFLVLYLFHTISLNEVSHLTAIGGGATILLLLSNKLKHKYAIFLRYVFYMTSLAMVVFMATNNLTQAFIFIFLIGLFSFITTKKESYLVLVSFSVVISAFLTLNFFFIVASMSMLAYEVEIQKRELSISLSETEEHDNQALLLAGFSILCFSLVELFM